MLRRPCYCPKHHLFSIWREYSVFEVRPLNTVTFSGMKRLGRIFSGVDDANRAPRAYIYALEAGFSQVAKNCQVFCQTVGGVFLTFLPKIKDGNSICQTAGDALTSGFSHIQLLPRKHISFRNFHKYHINVVAKLFMILFFLLLTHQLAIDS